MTNDQRELLAAGAQVERASREAARRFADTAWGRGAADVAYGSVDSPFGPLLVAVTGRGVVRLAYPNEAPADILGDLAGRVSVRMVESRRATDEVRRELEEYFEGRRQRFGTKVDLALARGFGRDVLRATSRIPFGSVLTYREVAGRAGRPAAVRATGNALGANPVPIVVPCHRVVRTGGGLGGYTGGLERKVRLLTLEGVLDG